MEGEKNTFDFEALKSTKRAHLLLELSTLLREFNNVVYTSQIRSKHMNEELSTLSDRTQAIVRTVSSDDAIILSHIRVNENELAHNCTMKQEIVSNRATDLMKSRQISFGSHIADISIPICLTNTTEGTMSGDGYEKLRLYKQRLLRNIQEMHDTQLVKPKKSGEEVEMTATSASETQPSAIRAHLKEEIRKYQRLLSKLEHSRYETLTSLDEFTKEDIRNALSNEKAKALACVRMFRNKLHIIDLHNDTKLRRLSSQAADCRSKLKDTFLILSKTIALARNQALDHESSIA
jgi:hypothetical protein